MPANDLQQLAQLLQLAGAAQAPQLEQQRMQQEGHSRNVAAALQALGLMQSGQEANARLEFEQQGLEQTGRHQRVAEGFEQQGLDQARAKETASEGFEGQRLANEQQHQRSIDDATKQSGGLAALEMLQRAQGMGQKVDPGVTGALSQLFPDVMGGYQKGQATADEQVYKQHRGNVLHLIQSGAKPEMLQGYYALNKVPLSVQQRFSQETQLPTARSFVQDPETTAPQGQTPLPSATTPSARTYQNYDAQGNPSNTISVPQHNLMDMLNSVLWAGSGGKPQFNQPKTNP